MINYNDIDTISHEQSSTNIIQTYLPIRYSPISSLLIHFQYVIPKLIVMRL